MQIDTHCKSSVSKYPCPRNDHHASFSFSFVFNRMFLMLAYSFRMSGSIKCTCMTVTSDFLCIFLYFVCHKCSNPRICCICLFVNLAIDLLCNYMQTCKRRCCYQTCVAVLLLDMQTGKHICFHQTFVFAFCGFGDRSPFQ